MRRQRSRSATHNQQGITRPLGARIPLISLIQTLAVAEYLNFRHAANALGIAQSSVSARIRALEGDLGVLLFERHTRGVRLTEEGKHFVDRVTMGIDHINYAVTTAGMVARGELGSLRIGVHALIPGSFLFKLLARYRDQHPRITVEITEGTARDCVMKLRAGDLDVTFLAGLPIYPDCHSRRLWSEQLVVAMPQHHHLAGATGVTWADLADNTFIVRRGGMGPQVYDHIVKRLADKSGSLSILRFDVERETLLSMVAQGYGITIAGEVNGSKSWPNVIFVPILDEPEPLAFSAVWSPHNRGAALRKLLAVALQMSQSSHTS